jgi:hypothetical protein
MLSHESGFAEEITMVRSCGAMRATSGRVSELTANVRNGHGDFEHHAEEWPRSEKRLSWINMSEGRRS